jgi:hypothetical protein
VKARHAVAYPRDLAQEDEHFGSAINDKGEVRGMMLSGRHLGITASNMRPGMIDELEIGRFGLTRLFVDSGAFSELEVIEREDQPPLLTWPKPITDASWQKRFAVYRWAAECYRDRAYLVAPDRVGDQDVTIERLTRYAVEVATWALHGANVIVCVQKGAMSNGDFFALASRTLKFFGVDQAQVVAGVPMEKARWSIDELRAFCETLPWFGARIHLLGLGPKAKRDRGQTLNRYWRAVEAIRAVRPNCAITSDSALAPSISGKTNGRANHPAEELGGPRIYTKLQAEARALGLRSSDAKEYGIKGEGMIEIDRDRIRAENAGWFDEELYDSVEEARAHRLAGYPEEPNAPSPPRFPVQLSLALGCLALAGCHLVFGVDPPEPGPGPDASTQLDGKNSQPDAPLPSQILFRIPDSVCQGALAGGSVYLKAAPAVPVTVTVTAVNQGVAVIDGATSWTFDQATWNLQQTVVVRGIGIGAATFTASAPGDNPVSDTINILPSC